MSAGRAEFECVLSAELFPYLSDYAVDGRVVLPAAAVIELALAGAGSVLEQSDGFELRDVHIAESTALGVSELELTCSLDAGPGGERDVRVELGPGARSVIVSGQVAVAPPLAASAAHGGGLESHAVQAALPGTARVSLGPSYRAACRGLRTYGATSVVEIDAAHARHLATEGYAVHPVLWQLAIEAARVHLATETPEAAARVACRIALYAAARPVTSIVVTHGAGRARAHLLDTHGGIVAALEDLHFEAQAPIRVAPSLALQWREMPLPVVPERPVAGEILVIGASALAADLHAALSRRGQTCVRLAEHRGSQLAAEVARHVRERRVARIAYVCERVAAESGMPAAALSDELHTLSLVAAAATTSGARLWVLTQGAHAFGVLEVDQPDQAAHWGFGVALALDAAKVWGGLIDLSLAPAAHELEAAIREIDAGDEDQVALRASVRHVPRLLPIEHTREPSALTLKADASYLITGGLGGLGLEVAERFAERGAGCIVLLGRGRERHTLDTVTESKLARIERRGSRVCVIKADVADAAAMRELADRFGRDLPHVAGVVHAAGVVQVGASADQSACDIARVARPKIDGTLLLESLFPPAGLDFFVCFSSGASVWGSRGLASYAAASGFMDAWARSRARRGAPAVSLNWGMWGRVGMSSDETRASLLSAIGLRAMEPSAALDAMERALLAGESQRVLIDTDWSTFRKVYEAQAPRRKLLCEVEGPPRAAAAQPAVAREHAAGSPVATRGRVRAILAELTGLADDAMDADAPLNTLGIDSISALDLQMRLLQEFGCKLAVSELVQRATVDDVIEQVSRDTNASQSHAIIPRRAPGAPECMSSPQERLWFLEQLAPGAAIYNVPAAIRVRGSLELAELQRAFERVLARHDVLRTRFESVDGAPVPMLAEHAELPCAFRDLSVQPSSWPSVAREEMRRPFDLARAPLLRLLVLRLGPDDHVIVMTMHHIVADAWSLGVLVRELVETPAAPLPIQFSDCAAWQRARVARGELEAGVAHWVRKLADAPRLLELPADRPRPAARTGQGALATFKLAPEVTHALKACAREHAVTPFAVCLAMYATLLHKYSRQPSICVGVPVAGREQPETHALIGFFVNTIVLCVDFADDLSVGELLTRVMAAAADGLAHQDVPFEQVVNALQPPRSASHTPLFQAGLAFQNVPRTSLSVVDYAIERVDLDPGVSKFDLHLTILEHDGEYEGNLEYSTDLFDAGTAERMVRHWSNLLLSAAAHPELPIRSLSLADARERERVAAWNQTQRVFHSEQLLHRCIEAQVSRTPERTAVSCSTTSVTYAELDACANHLAWQLREAGIESADFVGVFMERSVELVVALLAVLKSGAAYVPFDPSYPSARLDFLARDANTSLVLTHEPLRERAQLDRSWFVDLAALRAAGHASPLPDAPLRSAPAYMIYTSGSTGAPKGAINSHAAICNRLAWMQHEMPLDGSDTVLQKTPIGFDVSVWELFWPLIAGAHQVLAEPGGHLDPAYLAHLIACERVTTVHFVPSMLQTFLDQPALGRLPSLRRVVCSGEALSRELHDRALRLWPHADLYNLYGPTEAAVDVSVWKCSLDDGRRHVPIGRPIANTQLHVLDAAMHPLPPGVPGELFIGGVQVGLGYHERAELTRERFVRDPFANTQNARLYRTGDLARWHDDGTLEYLGRIDQQIKLNGCRIEPGEIETVLGSHPAVAEVAVVVRPYGETAHLVAYVVAAQPGVVSEELQLAMRGLLPEYMVPSLVVTLPQLPRSPNGKLDRSALPAPDLQLTAARIAARDETERAVAALWCELLGRAEVGVHENFFEVGGHSLLAARLAARMTREFRVPVSVAALLAEPTVARMAALLRGTGRGTGDLTLEYGPAGSGPTMFLVHPAGGDASCYRWIAGRLRSRARVVGVRSPALTGGAFEPDIPATARSYLHALRKVQSKGPYWLGGWSMGGVVAFEMAAQLVAANEHVAGLVLIDSLFPSPVAHAALHEASLLQGFVRDFAAMFGVSEPRIDADFSDSERWIDALHQACVQERADLAPTRAEVALRMRVYAEHCKAMLAYRPQPLPVRTALVLSQDGARVEPRFGSWTSVSQCVSKVVVDGDHYSLLNGPNLVSVAKAIQRVLEGSDSHVFAS